MITDPIGDLFTRIRNAVMAGRQELSVPSSRIKNDIAQVLVKEGYLREVKKIKKELVLTLSMSHRKPLITGIRNVSKPGRRIYRKADELPKPLRGEGISIVSTPKGVMSGSEAQKKRLGGEVLGEVW